MLDPRSRPLSISKIPLGGRRLPLLDIVEIPNNVGSGTTRRMGSVGDADPHAFTVLVALGVSLLTRATDPRSRSTEYRVSQQWLHHVIMVFPVVVRLFLFPGSQCLAGDDPTGRIR